MTSETIYLVNPASGDGRGHRVWTRLCDAYPDIAAGQVISEPHPEAAIRSLDRRLEQGADRLIAVGGDGTAHLAVNRLLEGDRGDIPFGLIPAGTGSDLARALALPTEAEEALNVARGEHIRPVDAIEVEPRERPRRFVVNVLSLGVSGVAVEELNRGGKKGSTAYLKGAIRAFRSYRPVRCRIELDGEPFFDEPLLLLAVANGTSFGKGMHIAPEAKIDDGLLDVVAIRPAPFLRLILHLPRVYLGTHLSSSLVAWRRARALSFEMQGELPSFDLDGEDLPPAPFSARIVPSALRVLAPGV